MLQFYHARSLDEVARVDAAELPTKDDPVAPAFCLCCVEVDRVSLLSLKSNERVDFEKVDGTWHATRVNP